MNIHGILDWVSEDSGFIVNTDTMNIPSTGGEASIEI